MDATPKQLVTAPAEMVVGDVGVVQPAPHPEEGGEPKLDP